MKIMKNNPQRFALRAFPAMSLAFVLGLGLATSTPAMTYYVDAYDGSDANSGIDPFKAWQSIARANQQAYGPGDSILLRRGCSWQGAGFKANGNGTVDAPIVLADYGEASHPPLIDAVGPHEPAVLLLNVQNWIVRNLELTQHGQTPQNLDPGNEKGKDADQFSDEYMRAVVHVLGLSPANSPSGGEEGAVRNIRLENLVVHDGNWTGIYASGGYYQFDSGRFGTLDNLVISGVVSYNHHKAGIEVTCTYYKTRIYTASNIQVLNSHLHNNGGDGVVVGPVQNGLIEGNLCEYNGRIRNARIGCWTWDSENTTIQFNESCYNMTPLDTAKARDGGGFDLDLGTENGMMQYNWSHDNQGEGFLLDSWPVGFGYSRGVSHNVQMRYNVGERDGKKLSGGITVFGGVSGAIYNNTIYYEATRPAGSTMFQGEGAPLTTSVWGKSGKPDLHIYNNIFISKKTGAATINNNLWTDGTGIFTFDNNVWWRLEGGLRFQWGTKPITTLTAWRAKGFDRSGMNADPLVIGPLGTGPLAYKLQALSPAINRGRVVTDSLRGMGPQDAFGVPTPQGAYYDIGASEYDYGQR